MQRVTAENKDLLNPSETIEYFKLSRRKFMLLSKKSRIMILLFLRQPQADYPNGI